ncbi:MAG: hydantoinase/oxoprolinase N-terminal domain-containing protein [Bdellovibrio sp.]
MSGVVGLHLGSSFLQTISQTPPLLKHFSGFSLSQSIRKAELPEGHYEVSGFLFEKLFQSPLGHRVAQIHSEDLPREILQISSQDHSLKIAVQERTSSEGMILHALEAGESREIAARLKEKKIERVCIQFLHQGLNPRHSLLAQEILSELGFRVFTPQTQGPKSISHFQTCALEALLWGAWEDLQKEAKTLPQHHLLFSFKSPLESFSRSLEQIQLTASAVGVPAADGSSIDRFTEASSLPLVHLGFESWLWMDPSQRRDLQSWGGLEFFLPGPRTELLSLQATSQLESENGIVDWGSPLGFDPGPVRWGRSLKLCLYDFFSRDPLSQSSDLGEKKRLAQMEIFRKRACFPDSWSAQHMQTHLFSDAMKDLAREILSFGSRDIRLQGGLSELIGPELQKRGLRILMLPTGGLQ